MATCMQRGIDTKYLEICTPAGTSRSRGHDMPSWCENSKGKHTFKRTAMMGIGGALSAPCFPSHCMTPRALRDKRPEFKHMPSQNFVPSPCIFLHLVVSHPYKSPFAGPPSRTSLSPPGYTGLVTEQAQLLHRCVWPSNTW